MHAAPDPDAYFTFALDSEGPASARRQLPAALWRQWWHAQHGRLDRRLAGHVRGFVIRRDLLRELGVTRAETRRHERSGAWFAPVRNVIAPVTVPPAEPDNAESAATRLRRLHALTCAAVTLLRPGQVVTDRSAAVLLGLPTFQIPDRPELAAAPDITSGRHGSSLVRVGALTPAEVTHWHGVPVTAAARTIIGLARHDGRDGLMAADAALREGLVTRRDLAQALDHARGWPGVRRAREIVTIADPLAESPLESLVRLGLHDSGLPAFDLQVDIGPYRVDLLLRRRRLVVEIDGEVKNSKHERWREKRRDRHLAGLGYTVVRVTAWDYLHDWPATAEAVRRLASPQP